MEKKCSGCGKLKDEIDFYMRGDRINVARSQCKECMSSANKRHYAANAENINKHNKTRRRESTDHTREIQRKSYLKHRKEKKEYYNTHRDKTREKSQSALRYAVKSGKITKPERCCIDNDDCLGNIHAHHEDYSKPFDVVWLCAAHHMMLHLGLLIAMAETANKREGGSHG